MSFRDDVLKERVEQVRPKIQKAREIAELAETEGREFTAGGRRSTTRTWPRAVRWPTR